MKTECLIACALALSAMVLLLGASADIFLIITGAALGFYVWSSYQKIRLDQRAYEAEIRNREVDSEFRSVVLSKVGILAYNNGELSFWSKRDLRPDQDDSLPEIPSAGPGAGQNLFDVLIRLDRVLIIGGMGSGKSELLKWLTSERAKQGELLILDSHAAPDTWPVGNVIGLGRDYKAIENAVRSVCQEMDTRYRLRSSGQKKTFNPLCMVIDEMTVLNQFTDLSEELKSLLCECRKVNIRLIVAGQSDRAGAMGLKGNYDLMTGFEAVCHLEKDGEDVFFGNVFFGKSKTPERFSHPGVFPACNHVNPVNPPEMRFKETFGNDLHSYAQETKQAQKPVYIDYMPGKPGLSENAEPADPIHGQIVRMWRNQESLNAIARAVFGSAGGVQNRKIKEVLNLYGMI